MRGKVQYKRGRQASDIGELVIEFKFQPRELRSLKSCSGQTLTPAEVTRLTNAVELVRALLREPKVPGRDDIRETLRAIAKESGANIYDAIARSGDVVRGLIWGASHRIGSYDHDQAHIHLQKAALDALKSLFPNRGGRPELPHRQVLFSEVLNLWEGWGQPISIWEGKGASRLVQFTHTLLVCAEGKTGRPRTEKQASKVDKAITSGAAELSFAMVAKGLKVAHRKRRITTIGGIKS